jgi:hypothetical protein
MAMRACKGLTVAQKPRYTALETRMTQKKDPQERSCRGDGAFVADFGVGSGAEAESGDRQEPKASHS